MNCPRCNHPASRVADSRPEAGHIRRRRVCARCGHRWSTLEYTEAQLTEYVTRQRGELLRSVRSELIRLAAKLSDGGRGGAAA